MPSPSTLQTSLSQNQNLTADLLAIDPGYRYFGYSLFNQSSIQKAGLCVAEEAEEWDRWTGQPPSFLGLTDIILKTQWARKLAVIEFPKVHRDTPNSDSIVRLAAACGAYTGLLQASGFQVEWIEPRSWKGTVPKDIMYNRILAKVPESEYSKIERIHDHNVMDAVGIGLWKIRKSRTT